MSILGTAFSHAFRGGVLEWSLSRKTTLLIFYIIATIFHGFIFLNGLNYLCSDCASVNLKALANLIDIFKISLIAFTLILAFSHVVVSKLELKTQEIFLYMVLTVSSIFLTFLALVYGVESGIVGISLAGAPLILLVLFNRKIAYFAMTLTVVGLCVLGLIANLGYLPNAVLYASNDLTNQKTFLFSMFSFVYFSLPEFLILLFVYDQMLMYWRSRESASLIVSQTDALTGLHNRRSIQDILHQQQQEGRGSNQPISVILLDIDHFKAVNDTFGHSVGDTVICGVTNSILYAVRQEDAVGRFGGEEFLIVLRHTTAAEAYRVAERCKQFIAESSLPVMDMQKPIKVTASFGVYCSVDGSASIQELIGQADVLLYEAKQRGRNCICYDDDGIKPKAVLRAKCVA